MTSPDQIAPIAALSGPDAAASGSEGPFAPRSAHSNINPYVHFALDRVEIIGGGDRESLRREADNLRAAARILELRGDRIAALTVAGMQ